MSTLITIAELKDILADSKGATPITMTTATPVTRIKAKNPWGKNLIKVSRVNGMIGWIYKNSVNNQRARENKTEDFHAQPRAWGKRLPGTPLVEHKDSFYLELKVENVHETPRYLHIEDGSRIPSDKVKEYLYSSKSSSRQGLDREVILRDYKLSNILQITIRREKYEISDTPHNVIAMFRDFTAVNDTVLALFDED